MKTTLATVLSILAASYSASGMAASEHDGHGAMAPAMKMQSQASDAQMVEGSIKKVDRAAGKVTIAHGPLLNLGMNMPMTMTFRVKDAAWLEQMKESDKIRFMADDINGVLTIVKFEPAK